MITYKLQSDGDISVKLDNRKVGEIRMTPHGFRYYPSGGGGKGAAYSSLEACKRSLEGE